MTDEFKLVEKFDLNFWNKPFAEILPCVAAFARSMDFDHQRGVFRKDRAYMKFECSAADASSLLKPMHQIMEKGGNEADCFTMRLIQLEASDGLCLLETSIDIEDLLFEIDPIAKLSEAQRYNFSYCEFDDGPFSIGFQVHDADRRIRWVFAHGQEENPSKGPWTFNQYGDLLSWENAQNYEKRSRRDRLTREHLTQYMSALGLNFATYASRQFHQVVEFRRNSQGQSLSQYDDEARTIAVEAEKYLSAVQAEFE